jgi:uncharacterized protein YbcV (DUF1398 family)
MDSDRIAVLEECVARSFEGTITFPEVVGKLQAIGIERYHADYARHENTYYTSGGDAHVLPMRHPPQPIAAAFSPQAIQAAIRLIRRGKIGYTEFLRQTMAAGCVGYFVQIAGCRVLYFGRNGEVHAEPFAAPQPVSAPSEP